MWLKYIVGYSNPQKYWDSRWKADLLSERNSTKDAMKDFPVIKEWMNRFSCKNILEIGCGKATLRGLPSYMGLDFSLSALMEGVLDPFVFADITERIPFLDNSFDAVLCRLVLLHISSSNIVEVVKEISRVASKVVILREPHGVNKRQVQPHCFVHDLPTLFDKYFDGHVIFLNNGVVQ